MNGISFFLLMEYNQWYNVVINIKFASSNRKGSSLMHCIVSIIYGFIIAFLILLSLIYKIKTKVIHMINKQKGVLYKNAILEEMRHLKKGKPSSTEHIIYLQKELKKVRNLLIFEDVLSQLEREDCPLLEEYCISISIAFQYLADYFRTKKSLDKAHFTYVLSLFPKILQNDDDTISYAMMHFVLDKSIYCRQYAMLFFYRRGSEKLVVNSLKKISKRNLYYSPRLLVDDLLLFNGNHKTLVALLLQQFDLFSPNFQVAIINYARFSKENRVEEIYQKFHSKKYDKEVDLTIIRYFACYCYEPMGEKLLQILYNKDDYNYEYRLVAAYALASYDTKKARLALIDCLSDYNWYVRKNAAISLSRMTLELDEIRIMNAITDPYANQMLDYVWQSSGKSFEKFINATVSAKPAKEKVGV